MIVLALSLIFFFIVTGLTFIFFYTLFRRIYLGRRHSEFECQQCGKCCVLKVRPSEKDIKRIEKHGFQRHDFMDGEHLRQVNNACIFLKKQDDLYHCEVHDFKPYPCRTWPFSTFFRGRFLLSKTYSCPGLARIKN